MYRPCQLQDRVSAFRGELFANGISRIVWWLGYSTLCTPQKDILDSLLTFSSHTWYLYPIQSSNDPKSSPVTFQISSNDWQLYPIETINCKIENKTSKPHIFFFGGGGVFWFESSYKDTLFNGLRKAYPHGCGSGCWTENQYLPCGRQDSWNVPVAKLHIYILSCAKPIQELSYATPLSYRTRLSYPRSNKSPWAGVSWGELEEPAGWGWSSGVRWDHSPAAAQCCPQGCRTDSTW